MHIELFRIKTQVVVKAPLSPQPTLVCSSDISREGGRTRINSRALNPCPQFDPVMGLLVCSTNTASLYDSHRLAAKLSHVSLLHSQKPASHSPSHSMIRPIILRGVLLPGLARPLTMRTRWTLFGDDDACRKVCADKVLFPDVDP